MFHLRLGLGVDAHKHPQINQNDSWRIVISIAREYQKSHYVLKVTVKVENDEKKQTQKLVVCRDAGRNVLLHIPCYCSATIGDVVVDGCTGSLVSLATNKPDVRDRIGSNRMVCSISPGTHGAPGK